MLPNQNIEKEVERFTVDERRNKEEDPTEEGNFQERRQESTLEVNEGPNE